MLRLVVSGVLIVWLLRIADISQIKTALAQANLFFIGLVILSSNADRVLMVYKWQLLLKAKQIHIPILDIFSAYYKASFLGTLFLPTVGADAMRIFEVNQQAKRLEDIISSVVIERVLGILVIFLAGFFSFALFTQYIDPGGSGNLATLLIILALTVGLFILSMKLGWLGWFRNRLPKWLPAFTVPFVEKFGKVVISYQGYSRHRKTLWIFFFWTLVEQLMPIASSYFTAKALHLDVAFITFVMFIPIIMIIIRLPISFDGFGVREGLYVYLFGLAGVPEAQAFLIGFVTSIMARFAIVPVALYFMLVYDNGKEKLNRPEIQEPTLAVEE